MVKITPQTKVAENEKETILRFMPIHTARVIKVDRQDIVVRSNQVKQCRIIDESHQQVTMYL